MTILSLMRTPTAGSRSLLSSWLIVASAAGCVEPTIDESGRLVAEYAGVAAYPVANLRFTAGPNGEIDLKGSAFAAGGLPYRAGPFALPPQGSWPITATLVSPAGDIVAVARTVITLQPRHEVVISVIAYPNLYSWFLCTPIIARSPISGAGAQPDTLYLSTSSKPISNLPPPVC